MQIEWTRELPKEVGWYWYRGDHYSSRGELRAVEIVAGSEPGDELRIWVPRMDFDDPLSLFVEDCDGEWCGPIATPVEAVDAETC